MAEQIRILTEKVMICPRIPSEMESSSQDHKTGGCSSTCPPNVPLSSGKSQQGLIHPPFPTSVHEQTAMKGQQAAGYFTPCITLRDELGADEMSSPSHKVLTTEDKQHLPPEGEPGSQSQHYQN